MGRLELPISDFLTDTKSALDNSLRVLQALTDASADNGYLSTTLSCMNLIQSLMQAKPLFQLLYSHLENLMRILLPTLWYFMLLTG